jgi:hypothetical protein
MSCPASNSSLPTTFIYIARSEKFQDCLVGMNLGVLNSHLLWAGYIISVHRLLMLCVDTIHGHVA